MTPQDIPTVTELGRTAFSEPWSEGGFAAALSGERNQFFVAEKTDLNVTEESDSYIAGYCGLYALGDEAELVNIAVSATDRRRGIGASLLETVLTSAGLQGVGRIYLEVRVSNEAAIRLYEEHGFKPCGIRKNFYRFPDEDALLMSYEARGR